MLFWFLSGSASTYFIALGELKVAWKTRKATQGSYHLRKCWKEGLLFACLLSLLTLVTVCSSVATLDSGSTCIDTKDEGQTGQIILLLRREKLILKASSKTLSKKQSKNCL